MSEGPLYPPSFQRIRLTIDMNTPALAGDEPMTELATVLRNLANIAEQDGLLGWMEIEDSNRSICGELHIETIEED
ncbi:MAG: hypothetical protein ACT4OK_11210 [Gemmobacter sp.]